MKKYRHYFLNEPFIMALILANALLIFIQGFDGRLGILNYFDSIFTFLFTIEMFVKIREFGFTKYIKNNWNKLDFILVLIALPSIIELLIGQNIIETNVLLAFRVLRVFKSFRLIKFIPNIDEMLNSIRLAFKASFVVVLGFVVMVFIVSLLSNSIYKDIAPEYFENPVTSMYAIFQLFSIEGWYEIPNLIAERSSTTGAFFSKLYFSVLLFGGGILGLSLVNSIFVDAMVSDNNDDLEAKINTLTDKIDELNRKIDEMR